MSAADLEEIAHASPCHDCAQAAEDAFRAAVLERLDAIEAMLVPLVQLGAQAQVMAEAASKGGPFAALGALRKLGTIGGG